MTITQNTKLSTRLRARVRVPITLSANQAQQQVSMVSFDGICDGKEHLAVLFGDALSQPQPLVRLHSECLTGDVFGSARCDCGPQLHEAIQIMSREGGIILYLRQEGRGIGLYNKLDAYRLQDTGIDTFAANRALHFPDDMRDYEPAAQMLEALGVQRIRLLSNNPEKARQLDEHGITVVAQQPTGVFMTPANRRYLQAKAQLAGHHLPLD